MRNRRFFLNRGGIHMGNTNLEKWAEQLLDTGKKNNLISFRDTLSSTAEILKPSAAELFDAIEGNTAFEVFDPKLRGSSTAEQKPITDRSLFYAEYAPKIRKKSQLLVFSLSGNPGYAMRTIEKRTREFLDETGVNVAYLAFGFIHWREDEHPDQEYLAPILLVPVSITRDSALTPYRIRSLDGDVAVNPTFSFKLNAEYGVKLPAYNDEGLEPYLDSIRELLSPLRWTVSSECRLGIFSFLKINMYQDLIDNEEKILANRDVRLLLAEPIEEPDSLSVPEPKPLANPLVELHSVVDADSSQMEAIELAKSGKSFVLQGPPGTGKSQTITNIIAECLYDGKKVLFVSEKLAALNVVYDKLRKAGLEDFCLELHSHKSSKRTVIDNLCQTLHADASSVSSEAETEISEKIRTQKQLDEYAYELHRKHAGVNLCLYQLFEKYSRLRTLPDVPWMIPLIEIRDEAYLRRTDELLRHYEAFLPTIGYEYRDNAWFGFSLPGLTYETRQATEQALKTSAELLSKLTGIETELKEKFECGSLSIEQMILWQRLFQVLSGSDFITPALLDERQFTKREQIFLELSELSRKIRTLESGISSEYEESVYSLNGEDLYNRLTKLYDNFFSRLFNQEYWKITEDIRLRHRYGRKPSYEDAVALTGKLRVLEKAKKEFREKESLILPYVGKAYQKMNTDWNAVLSDLSAVKDVLFSGVRLGRLPAMSEFELMAERSWFLKRRKLLEDAFAEGIAGFEKLYACFDPEEMNLRTMPIEDALARCRGCLREIDRLENWVQFRAVMEELREMEADGFIREAIRQSIPKDQFADCFDKLYYNQWIHCIISSVPCLSGFSRIRQDASRLSFSEKDVEQFEISRARIRSALSHKRPVLDMVTPGSPVYILQREGEKKRKQKSIRTLLSEIGPLVQTLKPCFLMSPLSVSTFLNPDTIHFDTVIFDEASQVFPQDAIGAIYRGTQTIVVGDSRQMPPSNFFNAMVDDLSSYDEDSDVTDFESILDLCSATMKQLRLKWHYRSRYEQLISFSNLNFYDNELVTFPSCTPDQNGIGIDYYPVDGLFDRKSHTNRKEAEFITDLIYQNIERFPERSLGVVAFSAAQQELIDDLLSRKRLEHPEKEAFFRADAEEPFFIKNLETVQGDERDTIIFSVAYGRDSQGRLLHNFGPLNRQGGERRLNVAITRAKYNVQLVSSMHHTDINLSKTASTGVRLLKEYLSYAENGESVLRQSLRLPFADQYDSDFETEVAEFLKSQGYAVDTKVGTSGYRIDVVVKHPDSSDYVLAIECDGAAYHSLHSTRDRDRLRQEVLERMGWKFYRIWSTDWFRNKQTEKERLLEAVQDALRDTPEQHPVSRKTANFETAVERHQRFKPYEAAEIESLIPLYGSDYKALVAKILEVESPLSEEWLLKRTLAFFRRGKVTAAVKKEYQAAMEGCGAYGIRQENGFLYRRDQNKVYFRSQGSLARDVKYISPEELASGLLTILSQNSYADKEGLYKTLLEYCGLKRMTGNASLSFDHAVNYLKDKGFISEENNQIVLNQK